MEKKLLNAAESRDKTTSATQDINRYAFGIAINIRLGETNCLMIVSSRLGDIMATKKKTTSKRSSSGSDPKSKRVVRKKMQKTMHEFKHHELKSGPGGKAGKVKNPKQAIAIGLSEARRSGAKIPKKGGKKTTTKKKGATKKSSGRKSTSKKTARRR